MAYKKLLLKKGYHLEITSWENDGDYYRTIMVFLEDKEEAIELKKMVNELFGDGVNCDDKIGNSESRSEVKSRIIEYLIKNPKILEIKGISVPKEINIDNFRDKDEDIFVEWIDLVEDYIKMTLGYSEDYYCRIAEKCHLYYAPTDIFVEELTS